ncbi:hypothetical protein GMB86_11950 [Terrilactibacillus sp. BCM23-1]|uniref:VWFA domain-containing protein n=1 Tax=Terrilactibacillus tamarindi TaxID=2599694 RepID=A0A6N8CR50_9BACI|nr:hypothetical protein [Terrilactibacillus tamarindi]MTT32719.1 hypothetical protein [Terrilactibacillus tamarindi]
MKFLDFMDKQTDPFINMALTDLARTLSQEPTLDVEFTFYSYYQKNLKRLTVSHYWSRLLSERKMEGMKSDVYLRAFGEHHYSDQNVFMQFRHEVNQLKYPQFSKQLFCLLEDRRLEKLCITERAGMRDAFNFRQIVFQRRFRERFTHHKRNKEWLDMIFCCIYLQIIHRPVALPPSFLFLKPAIRHLSDMIDQLNSTEEVRQTVKTFGTSLKSGLKDMQAIYFGLSEQIRDKKQTKELKPSNKCQSQSEEHLSKEKNSQDDKWSTWHEEQQMIGDNLLQHDLDQGKKTNLTDGDTTRIESGDQAAGTFQSSSNQSNHQQDDHSIEKKQETRQFTHSLHSNEDSEVNRHAKRIEKTSIKPTYEEIQEYQKVREQIGSLERQLSLTLRKTIEQKQTAPRHERYFGRLTQKKLPSLLIQNQPTLFYKKNVEEDQQLDAAFSLLVDCSASMVDKMEETKQGVILFHETLKALKISHEITGFWEDAMEATDIEQPNTIFQVISFQQSLHQSAGPRILQLSPEDDNRDGYAIRQVEKRLLIRPEKRKILLVFSDGEPSAYNYNDNNGIIDTYKAVSNARKKGIEVIGVFLGSEDSQDKEIDTMKKIYGRDCLIIPTIKDIPLYLTPLLKKLLFQII